MSKLEAYGNWVLFNAIGISISFIFSPIIINFEYEMNPFVLVCLGGITLGLIMGIAQNLAMRIFLTSINGFLLIISCVIGSLLAFFLGFAVFNLELKDPYTGIVFIIGGGLGGIIIGIIQWSALRRKLFQSWLWILSNAFAGIIGLTSAVFCFLMGGGFVHDFGMGTEVILYFMFLGGIIGALYGAISGIPLFKMQRVEEEEDSEAKIEIAVEDN